MHVNLDDSTDITLEKDNDTEKYILSIDSRSQIAFSASELKFIAAMIDSVLKTDAGQSRDSLQRSLKDAVSAHKAHLQNILRNMKIEDIALAVWYIDDTAATLEILANMSKRSAEDVQTAIKENIERRIRKERSEGKADIEDIMLEHGRSAAALLLKKLLDV
jgi:hypothetical protein